MSANKVGSNSDNDCSAMNYQVGHIHINSLNGEIQVGGTIKQLRPKTFQVLLRLLQNRHRIISKQELLDSVWQDVVTQEYVVYQSIKEIRSFFAGQRVIRTFPRQGYQWSAATLEQTGPPKLTPIFPRAFAASVLLIISAGLALYGIKTVISETMPVEQYTIVLKPVIDSTLNLLESSIGKSQTFTENLADHLVETANDNLHVVNSANKQDLQTPLSQLEPLPKPLLAADKSTYALHTQLFKLQDEFHLHYVLRSSTQAIRGVVFSNSLDDSFSQLTNAIQLQIENKETPTEKFAREAVFLGMSAFLDQDYVSAEALLYSATRLKPDDLASWRYLSKAQIIQGKFQIASQTLREVLDSTIFYPKNPFELKLLNQLKAIAHPHPRPARRSGNPANGFA